MRYVAYWEKVDRLVYLKEKATPEFWDSWWKTEGKPAVNSKGEVVTVTAQYLQLGSRVLEGGCGRADKVKAMTDGGFKAIGIDFAEPSVKQAIQYFPDTDIRLGDVRLLDFPDDYFDGYWSIGVIEHFWDGYGSILSEAARVIRPGGYLFLTAPWLSPYRKYKVKRGHYPCRDFYSEPENFYQFALNKEEVCSQLMIHGFTLVHWRGRMSEISMLEDMNIYQPQIEWLLRPSNSVAKRILRKAVCTTLNPCCGHSFLAIARLGNNQY